MVNMRNKAKIRKNKKKSGRSFGAWCAAELRHPKKTGKKLKRRITKKEKRAVLDYQVDLWRHFMSQGSIIEGINRIQRAKEKKP